jgi:hypothetical protein
MLVFNQILMIVNPNIDNFFFTFNDGVVSLKSFRQETIKNFIIES